MPVSDEMSQVSNKFLTAMTSLSFLIRAADQVNVKGRAIRRVLVSNNVMKLSKSCAGDFVVLAPASIGDSQHNVRTRLISCKYISKTRI